MSLALKDEKKFLEGWTRCKNGKIECEKKMNKLLNDGTQKERENVDKAVDALNKKAKQIMSEESFKKLSKDSGIHDAQMTKHLNMVTDYFFAKQEKIMADATLSEKEKLKQFRSTYDHVVSKLYTPEEIREFKNRIVMIHPLLE